MSRDRDREQAPVRKRVRKGRDHRGACVTSVDGTLEY